MSSGSMIQPVGPCFENRKQRRSRQATTTWSWSRQDFLDDVAMDVGQAHVAAAEMES
jgi:hypothetical protein